MAVLGIYGWIYIYIFTFIYVYLISIFFLKVVFLSTERRNFQIVVADVCICLLGFLHVFGCVLFYFRGWKTAFVVSWLLSKLLLVDYLAFAFVLFSSSRALGYIAGLALRRWINQTFKYCGCWDIHFGYVSLFITFDKVQVTAHNVVWRNHGNFHQTPVSVCIVNEYIMSEWVSEWVSV